jgi:hypothetical protein
MVIKCEERYNEAREYAEKTGDKTLWRCLDQLEEVNKYMGCETTLYKDHAPLSFLFKRIKNGEVILSEGLIYHGNPDVSMAFQIEPFIGWQIHT